MKAFVRDVYGLPDVLSVEDVEIPTPAPDEVLLEVCAASINGAGGGIGTFAVQLAKHFGAEVHAMGKLVATIRERPSMIEATAVGS